MAFKRNLSKLVTLTIATALTILSGATLTVNNGGTLANNGRLDMAAHANNVGLLIPTNAGAPSSVTGTTEGDLVYDTAGNALYAYDGAAFTEIGGAPSALTGLITVSDPLGTPTGNIFQVQNANDSARYLTVSSTSTIIIGNVGIGIATPSANLDIFQASADTASLIHAGPLDSAFDSTVKTAYLDISNSVIGYHNNLEAGAGVYTGLTVLAENDIVGDVFGFQAMQAIAVSSQSSGNKGLVLAGFFQAAHRGAGTVDELTAFSSFPLSSVGSGLVGTASGIVVSPSLEGSTTDLYRIRIQEGASNGTITNSYGLYIDEMVGNGDVLNYSIFVQGATSETPPFVVEATGNVGIGTKGWGSQLTVADSLGSPASNIFEVGNFGGSSKYFTVSSTSTSVNNGSQTEPGLNFIGDTNTGIYSFGSNTIGFATDGTVRFTLGANNQFAGVAGTAGAFLQRNGGATIPTFAPLRGDTTTGIASAGAGILSLVTGANESMRIDSTGKATISADVGSPTGNLFEVQNFGGSSKYLTVSSTSTIATSLNLTADSNQILLDSDGNITTLTTSASGAITLTFPSVTDTLQGQTLARIAGSTFSTVQDLQNIFHSAGWVSGGGITDDADGTITVALGTGLIRATNGQTAEILYFDWAEEAGANVNLADLDTSYVYLEYNAGSPRAIATTTVRTDKNTNVLLATIYRDGTSLHINTADKFTVGDHAALMIQRLLDTMAYGHKTGAILSEVGTREIDITAGAFWRGLTEFTTSAVNTTGGGGGTFSYYYKPAGAWTKVTAQTQIDNTQYNNFGTGLATLSNNKYGVHWEYVEADDDDISVLYGVGDYTLAEAQAATAPSSVPEHLNVEGIIIGKIIIKKSDSVFTQIESAFETTFQGSLASDHGNLAGLADDDHTQYLLANGTRTLDGQLRVADGLEVPVGNIFQVQNSTDSFRYLTVSSTSTNILGDLDIGLSKTLSFSGISILVDSSGTLTLSNIDALDSTTATTIATGIDAATTSAQGGVELATTGETTTGTATALVVTPDGLAGSIFGQKSAGIILFDGATAVTAASNTNAITIPASMNGMNITDVIASVTDKGITGTTDVTVWKFNSVTGTVEVLSTDITLGDEFFATDGVINTSNDDLQTGDQITFEVTGIHSGTAPNGLTIVLTATTP